MAFPLNGIYRILIPSDSPLCFDLGSNDRVNVTSPDAQKDSQKWNVHPVTGKADTYKITTFDGTKTLTWQEGSYKGDLVVASSATTEWIVEYKSPHGPRITTSEKRSLGHYVDSCNRQTAHFWSSNDHGVDQHWAFEYVQGTPGPGPNPPTKYTADGFREKFFTLTVEEAAIQEPGKEYDIIVVGSGIGGGVLCNDLWDTNLKIGDTAKRVLLLEKGDLVFHSHCLNTARPAGLANDRGQQNDTFFHKFKKDFTFEPKLPDTEWNGGAMYCLGGRSAAWGLFAPRIHDDYLDDYFGSRPSKELKEKYYDMAERLMLLSLPTTKRVHQHVMDRLNMSNLQAEKDSKIQWQWGRIASEFHDDRNFDFAEGAYSSIDKILEIAMSKREDPKTKELIEHDYFKTVLNADVRSLDFDNNSNVTAVNVLTQAGKTVPIKLKQGGSVVLCAGSVHTPAILLRSGHDIKLPQKIKKHKGLRLTDHDIFYYSHSFRYHDPSQREQVGAMKLQTYVHLPGSAGIALANMSIDASSFLPRGETPDRSLPQFIMVFVLKRDLVPDNTIELDPETGEPVVTMERGSDPDRKDMEAMRNLTASCINSLIDSLGIRFVGDENQTWNANTIKLNKLQLGGVAHELGTVPMSGPKLKNACLDENLCMVPELCNGVYVCDLSLFPWSPEVNPTLTLAALAIRLSRTLNPRLTVNASEIGDDKVVAVNHSGERIKVWLTNYRDGSTGGGAEEPRIIESGKDTAWTREPGTGQGLFVFRRDQASKDPNVFLKTPEIYTAFPKKPKAIHP